MDQRFGGKMIISFTCNNIGTGGAERVICNIANQMAREGHTVRIICYEKLSSFYYQLEKKVTIVELDANINKRKHWLARKLAGFVNLYRLFQGVKGSDKIISFYTRQNCYSILVGHLRRIPVICAERDHFFMNDGKANHILRNIFYPHADGFIHQTYMAREWLREKEGVKCRDIVIPNPLWINEFPDCEPITGNVIAMGRLAEQKNYRGMIEAFKIVHQRNKNAMLHIYGDGEQREELQKFIKEVELENNVILEGMTKDVINVYKKAQVFVMFSHGEGYPNALMEALAIGIPSVSSDCPVGGPRDMIMDGKNGFLVKCDDTQALAERILQLLDSSELREEFQTNAITIRETNNFLTIYNKIMEYIGNIEYGNNKKNL